MDIAQEAAVKLLRSAGKIKNPDYIGTMAYRVVVNCSIDFLRKQKRETIGLPEVERGAEDDHGKLYALDLLDVLDQKAKTIVVLRFFEGFSLAEIADIMDLKLSTVKTRLYSSLRTLKRELERQDTRKEEIPSCAKPKTLN